LLLARVAARRRRRGAAFGIAIAIAGFAWFFIAREQVARIDRRIEAARAALAPIRSLEEAQVMMSAEQAALDSRARGQARLRGHLPATSILALLTALTPADVVLLNISVAMPEAGAKRRPGPKSDQAIPSISIDIEGTAPDEVAATAYAAALSAHDAIGETRLEDTRRSQIDGVAGSLFRIHLEIPIERAAGSASEGSS